MSRPVVLAVALSTRIIGLAVVTSEDLEHVAMHDVRKARDEHDLCRRVECAVARRIARHEPTHLAVVDCDPSCGSRALGERLHHLVTGLAQTPALSVITFARAEVRRRFTDLGTVRALSKSLVVRFPELVSRALPDRPRIRADDVERARIPVLLAVAAADLVVRDTLIKTL